MTSNLPALPSTNVPKVTDDAGNPLVGPELEAVVKLVNQMAQTAQLARIRQALEREQFEGKSDNRVLNGTLSMQTVDLVHAWPFTPWIRGTFRNRGPGILKFAVNADKDFRTLHLGESDPRDHSKAAQRIEQFYFYCEGQPAVLEVEGAY